MNGASGAALSVLAIALGIRSLGGSPTLEPAVQPSPLSGPSFSGRPAHRYGGALAKGKTLPIGPTQQFEIFGEEFARLDAERRRRLFVSILRTFQASDRAAFIEATREPLRSHLLPGTAAKASSPEQVLCERLLPDDVGLNAWKAGTRVLSDGVRFECYQQMLRLLEPEARQRVNHLLAGRPLRDLQPIRRPGKPRPPRAPCVAPNMIEIDVVTSELLNPSEAGQPLPTVLHIYQLKGHPDVRSARMDDFLADHMDFFGRGLLDAQELTINPSERVTQTYPRSKGASHLVVVGLFKTVRERQWLVVHDLGSPQQCSRLMLLVNNAQISVRR